MGSKWVRGTVVKLLTLHFKVTGSKSGFPQSAFTPGDSNPAWNVTTFGNMEYETCIQRLSPEERETVCE